MCFVSSSFLVRFHFSKMSLVLGASSNSGISKSNPPTRFAKSKSLSSLTSDIKISLCFFHGKPTKYVGLESNLKCSSSMISAINALYSFSLLGKPFTAYSLTLPVKVAFSSPVCLVHFCFCVFSRVNVSALSVFSNSPITLISTKSIVFPSASSGLISNFSLPKEFLLKSNHVTASNTVVFPVAFSPEIAVLFEKLIERFLMPLKFSIVKVFKTIFMPYTSSFLSM